LTVSEEPKPRDPRVERYRLIQVLTRAPGEYRVLTNSGTYATSDAPLVERCHRLREVVVEKSLEMEATRAELGSVLIELAASVWRQGVNRETFLANAGMWWDSVAEAWDPATSPGGSA
jgi:hypothetical protein